MMATATVREPDYIFLKDFGAYILEGSKVYKEQGISDEHPNFVVHLIGSDLKMFLIKPHIKIMIEDGYLTPNKDIEGK